jgi:hypothetical protein
MTRPTTPDLVATSHRLFDLATPVRAEAAAMSDAEKPWPAEYATALDAVVESARLLAVAVHELTVLAFPPRLPLCPDCVDGIGGACAGPDAEWRPALPGESCGAADCSHRLDHGALVDGFPCLVQTEQEHPTPCDCEPRR